MRITDGEVRKLSNLADFKLKEVLKQNRGIKPQEVISRAQILAQDARLRKDTLDAEKLEDLVESVTQIQNYTEE